MFNDERITKELSNLKKYLIILSVVVSSIFLTIKVADLILNGLSIIYYFTELVIIISGLFILIGSLFIKTDIKDEVYYEKKNDYYNNAFKIFVLISFLSFSCVMGGTILDENELFSSALSINVILPLSLFTGYAYLRYKNIYFNYNIIEEDKRIYYRGVFKNILKIIFFFFIIYFVGLIMTFFYNQNSLNIAISSIISAFFTSSISVSLYYFIISLFERSFIKDEENKKITSSSIILIVLALLFNITYSIISIKEKNLINQHAMDPSSIENFSAILYELSSTGNFFNEWSIHLIILGMVFFIYDITKNNKTLRNKSNIPLLIFIIYNCFSLIIMKADPLIIQIIKNLSQNDISMIINIKYLIIMFINTGILILLFTMIFIKFKEELTKNKGLLLLIVSQVLIFIINFSLSFRDNLIIQKYIQISWMIILLIVFTIYLIKLHKKEVEFDNISN